MQNLLNNYQVSLDFMQLVYKCMPLISIARNFTEEEDDARKKVKEKNEEQKKQNEKETSKSGIT